MTYTTHIAEINQAEAFAKQHEREAAQATGELAEDHRLIANLYRQVVAKLRDIGRCKSG